MANSENTITSVFVNVLRHMRDAWNVSEQITKPFLDVPQKPDVIVTEAGRNPVVIEVKIDGDTPNFSGKLQAEAHFGMLLDPSVFRGLTYNTIENVLRVRMPVRFRTMPQDQIESEMHRAEDIAYILLNKPKPESEAILFQKAGVQTSRMAMLIVTNAFVFQSVLAGKPEMESVMSLKRMLSDNAKRLRYEQVIAGWDIILKVNYRPIFPCCQTDHRGNCN